MPRRLGATLIVTALALTLPLSLAHADGDDSTSGASFSAGTSGNLVTVQASVRSERKGKGHRKTLRARGPAERFVTPVQQPQFFIACSGSGVDMIPHEARTSIASYQIRTNCVEKPAKKPGARAVDLGPIVQKAVNRLQLPKPDVRVMPDPKNNKWNAIPVGYPIWFYNPRVKPKTQTVTEQGISITITARPGPLEIDTGEKQLKCRSTTKWRFTPKAKDSPTCGYRYQKKGDYVIKTVQPWFVTWTTGAHTGDLAVTTSQETKLHINELVLELVKPRG